MPYSMTFTESQYEHLMTHLFAVLRNVERAAYLLCRTWVASCETRLLVRSTASIRIGSDCCHRAWHDHTLSFFRSGNETRA